MSALTDSILKGSATKTPVSSGGSPLVKDILAYKAPQKTLTPPSPYGAQILNDLSINRISSGLGMSSTTPSIGVGGDPIIEAAKAGAAQTIRGGNQVMGAKNLIEQFYGVLNSLGGELNTVTAPLAVPFAPISGAIGLLGDYFGKNTSLQKFANSSIGQQTSDFAEATGNAANLAGFALGEGGLRPKVEYTTPKMIDGVPTELRRPIPTEFPPVEPIKASVAPESAPIAPTMPKVSQPSIGTVSKAAADINRTIVSRGIEQLPEEELAKFTSTTKEEQVSKVSALLTDYENAKQMAVTGENIPSDVKAQVLFNAVKNKAIAEADGQTLRDLAKSPIATERSIHAQELGSAGYNNGEIDPVRDMADIQKVRSSSTKVKSTVMEAKQTIAKTNTKQTWTEFINSIEC